MFNGVGFNSAALNATTAVALVFATASFTAEATVTASALQEHAGRANIVCSVESIFGGTRTQFGRTDWQASAVPTFTSNTIHAGAGDWDVSLHFRGVVLTLIQASGAWEAGASSFEIIPDAKLGTGAWSAGAEFADVTSLSFTTIPIRGDWDNQAALVFGESDLERQCNAAWLASADFRAEASITTGGLLQQDAFADLKANAAWQVDNTKNPVFINYTALVATAVLVSDADVHHNAISDISVSAQWEATGIRTHGAKANFVAQASLVSIATKIQQFEPQVWSAGLTLEAISGVLQQARVTLDVTGVFASEALQRHAAIANWSDAAEVSITADRIRTANMALQATASSSMYAMKESQGEAAWSGSASTLGSAGVLTLVAAPLHRQLIMSGSLRKLKMSGSARAMRLS